MFSAGGMSDKANGGNNSSFRRHPASNNEYQNFANVPALVMNGATGLIAASSQTAQHQQNPSSLVAQSQALAQHQQRLLNMTRNEFDVQQIASNIKESLLIKRRLQSIQHLQQQEANKSRAGWQITANGIGGRNNTSISSSSHGRVPSSVKPIPSTSNSSILPTKKREDEMTKPDLSTLAETAVAVASAITANNTPRRSSSGIMGRGSITENNMGSNHIVALLGRQVSTSQSEKGMRAASLSSLSLSSSQSVPTSITSSISNNAMTDALRRDTNTTRGMVHLEHNFKRSLDEMTKSNTTTAPLSSSWLWKSATLGNRPHQISMEQLRAQHEQLQRRNSLPARASAASSEFASLRSLKRQRLHDRKTNEIRGLEYHDAMNQMRQMKMPITSKSSLLALMASKIASQERRASIASSIASIGTSATAPNLTTNSSLSSPVNRRNLVILDGNFDGRSNVLNKLSNMGGGFPMPKFSRISLNTSGGIMNKIPAEITPELGRDVVDMTGREISSLSLKEHLGYDQQSRYLERIGGFPMPPLYRRNDENYANINDNNINDLGTGSNNAVSSHIRNNLNRTGTKASRPPTLESFKRVWRDIRVLAGDDPRVDERLRKEVFARKLQRGEIFVGKTGNSINMNSYIHQQRLSELAHGSTSNNNGRSKCSGTPPEESIVI
jgi:hypothetical protein